MVEQDTEYAYDVFISHAEADRAWVQGYLLPALGLPPERVITPQDFRPGAPVVTEFERAVTDSRYTVLVLSPAYLADEWSTFGELLISHVSVAEQRDRLIPLLLQPCTLPLRVDFRVRLDCTDEANWERGTARLRALLDQPEPTPERIPCPYPGMVPFSAEDARFFYGRKAEIRQMIQHLCHQRFLFVIGPSGCGKSSLVFAGLLPRLAQSTYFPQGFWLVREMRPGDQPLSTLAQALGGDPARPTQALADLLVAHPPAQRLLLVIDQFEELFTQTGQTEQSRFIAALQALRTVESCALLIAMRADFYPDLMNSDLWPVDPSQRLEIAPLRGEALRQAILRPAADMGVYLEAGLLERLLADAADEPGVLPLLQETMVLLWGEMQRRLLPLSAYERLGGEGRSGLAVAVTTKASATLADLSDEQRTIARRIFLRLVQFGEGRADTRRQQPVAALRVASDEPDLFDQTLRHLTDNRLLTLSGEEGDPTRQVDIAHEALIAGWPTLRGWLAERREAEQTRRRLEAKVVEWVRLGRGTGGLLDEVELLEAERWLASPDAADLGYGEALPALVEVSREAIEEAKREKEAVRQRELAQARALAEEQQRRADEQARAAKRLRRSAAALAVVFLLAVVAAVLARMQQQRAEQQARIATSRQLAAQALYYLDDQLDLALLLSLEACRTSSSIEAQRSLLTGLEYSPELTAFLHGQTSEVNSVAFSPDGKTLASGSCGRLEPFFCAQGEIRLWDVATRRSLGQPLTGHASFVYSLAFSPDGKTLASGSYDGTIILWDVVTRQPIGQPLVGHTRMVNSVAFSPDGKMLASGSYDGAIILWDVATRQPIGQPLTGHTDSVRSVAFSPDGEILASGGHDRIIILWDVATRQPIGQPLTDDTGAVNSVAFNPEGKMLASGGCGKSESFPCDQGEIRLWDVATCQPIGQPLTGHAGPVNSVAFSPEGKTLVSGSEDKTIILWDVATRQPIGQPLAGHARAVNSVAFSPDGKTLASGSGACCVDDKPELVLWDVATYQPLSLSGGTTRQRIGQPLIGHTRHLDSVAFGPDGEVLASGGCGQLDLEGFCIQGEIHLWDVASRQLLGQPLSAHSHTVTSVVFSPNGKALASGSFDGTIILWDVATREPIGQPLIDRASHLNSVAFSPDGKVLASGGCGQWDPKGFCIQGDIRLWDVATRQPIGQPLTYHNYLIDIIAFSPDGRTLASGSATCCIEDMMGIMMWDIESRQPLGKLLAHRYDTVTTVAFSPNGKMLASDGSVHSVMLWNVTTRQPIGQPLTGHAGSVSTVAFSPDGEMLASGSRDRTIILWDVATRRAIGQFLTSRTSWVSSVAFSPDGKMLASGNWDGPVILWDVSLDSWQARGCRMVNRNLTQAEWNKFIGSDIPYECTCPDLPPGEGAPPDACGAPP